MVFLRSVSSFTWFPLSPDRHGQKLWWLKLLHQICSNLELGRNTKIKPKTALYLTRCRWVRQ